MLKKIVLIMMTIGMLFTLATCKAESAEPEITAEEVAESIADITSDEDGNVTISLVNGKQFVLGNLKGEPGKDGKDGKDGRDGRDGKDGAVGAQGVQGIQGEKGETGAQGIQGETGEKGEKGDKGDPGKPAPTSVTIKYIDSTPSRVVVKTETKDNVEIGSEVTYTNDTIYRTFGTSFLPSTGSTTVTEANQIIEVQLVEISKDEPTTDYIEYGLDKLKDELPKLPYEPIQKYAERVQEYMNELGFTNVTVEYSGYNGAEYTNYESFTYVDDYKNDGTLLQANFRLNLSATYYYHKDLPFTIIVGNAS